MATKTNKIEGLSTKEAQKRLLKYGYNEVEVKKNFTALKIIISQFTSFLVVILIISGIVSVVLGETIDGIAIFAIVILNAIIGFIQEYKAENAVAALKKMIVPIAIVIRDNEEKEISIKELVPGDIVILSEGDKIPADLEVIESFSLRADESILTGESISVRKNETKDYNKLFKGTLIVSGRGKALVLKTGKETEFGKIINLVSKQEKTDSPLSTQLDILGKKLGIIVIVLITIVFLIGKLQGISWLNMFMTSISLGVSAIPEGMPIIVTLTLAMGVSALAKKNAIVRKMNSIETLGSTTVICSDKTGTLTMNEMTVKKIFVNNKDFSISGTGYTWTDKIKISSKEEEKLMEICENCNNAFIGNNIIGDPTEISLKVLARKSSHLKDLKKLDEMAFTSERKMMSTLHKTDKGKEIFAKGAFEEIIKKCSHIEIGGKQRKLTAKDKKDLLEKTNSYAKEALRVLAFAYKTYEKRYDEDNLIFVGIVGMIDPPREEVKEALKIAKIAGIKVKIITGDNPITAKAIGEKLGLKVEHLVTGDEIDSLNNAQLIKIINKTEIFARTNPGHKYRIVDLLKKNNEIVAVTGDGINDAPALRHADVGVAMGIKGTEATKEVADIVLKDDNFSTIVNTIKEGRRIYQNILAFVKYLLSANFYSIVVVGIITILGYPLPLLPLQILWINMATDALPALALGSSEADKNIMEDAPHKKNENFLKKFAIFIGVTVVIQTIANIILYFYGMDIDADLGRSIMDLSLPSHTRTLVFTETVLFEILLSFVCKTERAVSIKSFFSNKWLIFAGLVSIILQIVIIYTPFTQEIFKTVPLSLNDWFAIVLFSLTAFLVPSITKIIRKIYALRHPNNLSNNL